MDFPYAQVVRIQFPSARAAQIVHDTLAVDRELKPERSQRELRIENESTLVAYVVNDHPFELSLSSHPPSDLVDVGSAHVNRVSDCRTLSFFFLLIAP